MMAKLKDVTIEIDVNTEKFRRKLRAIAKHTGALVDELDNIDSGECTNLSEEQIELIQGMINRNKKGMKVCSCDIQRVLNIKTNYVADVSLEQIVTKLKETLRDLD